MKTRRVPFNDRYQASDEYLDKLNKTLWSWIEDNPDAYTFPEFLKSVRVGWSFFRWCVSMDPQLKNTFEVVQSILHGRWLKHAFMDKIFSHREKVLLRYLRIYDAHSLQIERDMKAQVDSEVERAKIFANYEVETYKNEQLEGKPAEIYEKNLNKRRSKKKT